MQPELRSEQSNIGDRQNIQMVHKKQKQPEFDVSLFNVASNSFQQCLLIAG